MGFSKQGVLGAVMLFGGGVLLYAMVQQINDTKETPQVEAVPTVKMAQNSTTSQLTVQPLTTDIETETRLLEEKNRLREEQAEQQEARTQEFLRQQEEASKRALAEVNQENQQFAEAYQQSHPENDMEVTHPVVTERQQPVVAQAQSKPANQNTTSTTVEMTNNSDTANTQSSITQNNNKPAEPKPQNTVASNQNSNPTEYKVNSGDALIRVARKFNVPVAALAQANDISTNQQLQVGQKLTIPSQQDIDRLQKEAAAAEAKRLAELKAQQEAAEKARQEEEQRQRELQAAKESFREADQELRAARQSAADARGTFGVQVALANNQELANNLVQELKAAGYSSTTSATSRGIRVIAGPERGKTAALALRDKINNDPNLSVSGAWVLYWR